MSRTVITMIRNPAIYSPAQYRFEFEELFYFYVIISASGVAVLILESPFR